MSRSSPAAPSGCSASMSSVLHVSSTVYPRPPCSWDNIAERVRQRRRQRGRQRQRELNLGYAILLPATGSAATLIVLPVSQHLICASARCRAFRIRGSAASLSAIEKFELQIPQLPSLWRSGSQYCQPYHTKTCLSIPLSLRVCRSRAMLSERTSGFDTSTKGVILSAPAPIAVWKTVRLQNLRICRNKPLMLVVTTVYVYTGMHTSTMNLSIYYACICRTNVVYS